MLKDVPRNKAYKQAVFDNIDQIKGRIILDVGAGTGILSVFCAQAGAAKVYAVEASNVSKIAQEVVKENGFDKVIEVSIFMIRILSRLSAVLTIHYHNYYCE